MGYRLFAFFVVLFAGFLVTVAVARSASAQQRQQQFRQQFERGGDVGLPSWAAPGGNARPAPASNRSGRLSAQQQQDCGALNAPGDCTLPEPPSQVPLGGLEWLVVAGGAYAANRLRRKQSSADDDTGSTLP